MARLTTEYSQLALSPSPTATTLQSQNGCTGTCGSSTYVPAIDSQISHEFALGMNWYKPTSSAIGSTSCEGSFSLNPDHPAGGCAPRLLPFIAFESRNIR